MRRSGHAVVLLMLVALIGGAVSPGVAWPEPPNPGDDELTRSRERVGVEAAEVGRLTALLTELDRRTDDIQATLAVQRETAEAALSDLRTAREAAVAAEERAASARVETEAASVAVDHARAQLDEFVAATYLQRLDLGPLGLLTTATSPDDLVARLEFDESVARAMLAAQDGLERARVAKANADSAARAALDEARAAAAAAQTAKDAADAAFAAARAAARAQAARLAEVRAERETVERRLAAAEAHDAELRARRERYRAWERRAAAEQTARERAAREEAAARLGGRGGASAPARGAAAVRTVIDRAMAQLGVPYVWGGGNGRGPTVGIPDGLGSPLDRIGFDCSGLMVYAFNGAGVALPRVSRNQFNAGWKVPIDQIQPGDMVFYRRGSAPIHHVALYIGAGRMIEAPYTGARVRITPLRREHLVPQAVRVL